MGKYHNPERFPDPIAVKPKDKKVPNPWNFDQPSYDERSSCFVNAGSCYGVGHKTPVGKEGQGRGLQQGPIAQQAKAFPSQYIHKGPTGVLDTEDL